MFAKKHSAMAVVAVFVAVLLSVLGINRIGGETWTSAANAGPGWRAYTGTVTPPPAPVLRALLVPALMILAVIAVAALAVLLKRYAGTANDEQADQETIPNAATLRNVSS